ncbi:MAG: Imm63 family immunity protein [Rhizomicrobium sp.]
MPLSSTSAIVAQALEIGAKHGFQPADFRYLDQSNDFACPFIEVDRAYHLVVRERGKEFERHTTADLDELLYWVFDGVTFGAASEYELHHRDEKQDFRRILFSRQLELLGEIDPAWRTRCAAALNQILLRHPFADSGPQTVA